MYVCNNCGNESIKWTGQCGFCKDWNTLVEFKESKNVSGKISGVKKELQNINSVENNHSIIVTKSSELNNLLGGGIVLGGVTLLSGEPGIGKSTLALQLANWVDKKIIYISGEETINQIAARAKRLNIVSNNIHFLCENNLENIIETLNHNPCDLIIIDSISVISSGNGNSPAGSISQVKECAESIVNFAKQKSSAVVIIGHVNKDGNLAGPKTLEHLVDTVLYFEGEKFEDIRILRSFKNRFGSTGEVAIFKMGENGLDDLANPGLEFISSENTANTIGSSLSITIEGSRPILVEIESLTNYTKFGYPKRSARGINTSKLDLIIAVLSKYSKINLDSYDAYINIVRGIKVGEPGIDLSIGASIISSKSGKPIPRDTVFIGEISLTGRIKNCINIEKRIKEAIKLGFKNIYVPNIDLKEESKANIIKIKDIQELVAKIVGQN